MGEFYTRVLGFEIREQKAGGYTGMQNGDALLSLNDRRRLNDDHPVQALATERAGRGLEIVLSVADIDRAYEQVKLSGWPLASDLAMQPWGLVDFRIIDPDGYYIRITSSKAF